MTTICRAPLPRYLNECATHVNESCHTCERVMLHMWASVTRVNESWCTCARVTSHSQTQATALNDQGPLPGYLSKSSNKSCHTFDLLMCEVVQHVTHRPTQSMMYVPLQVNRFKKIILLNVQYKYLKSCSRRFYCPNLILRTRLCGTMFITQPSCLLDFHLRESVRRKWFVLAVYQFWKGISEGPALKYFTWFIGAGGLSKWSNKSLFEQVVPLPFEWVVQQDIWAGRPTSHVTHVGESCHTCKQVMSHMWTSHVTPTSHVTQTSHVTPTSHVTHVNESCHTRERVTQWTRSHVWHDSFIWASRQFAKVFKWVVPHMRTSHVTIKWFRMCDRVTSQSNKQTKMPNSKGLCQIFGCFCQIFGSLCQIFGGLCQKFGGVC